MPAGRLNIAGRLARTAGAPWFAAWLLAGAAMLSAGCASLSPPSPPSPQRCASAAFVDTGDTRLARVIAPFVQAHPGRSGVHALPDAYDAFAARVALAVGAERSIDA